MEEKYMLVEAQLSSSKDEIEGLESALLELSQLYDNLVDQNKVLKDENKRIYSILQELPFEIWNNNVVKKKIELSVESVSDIKMNSLTTRKNGYDFIEEE